MNDNNRKGPDPATLKHLAGMMPSFTSGFIERRTVGKGRPVADISLWPAKACGICGKAWDVTAAKGTVPVPEPCPECAARLAEGYIAFTDGREYIFARCKRLQDMAGTRVQLSPAIFAKIKSQYEAEWKHDDETQELPPAVP